MFVLLVSLLLFTVIHNTNAQEAEHENDTTTEDIDFLQFYDNELFLWNFNKFNGNNFSIPQMYNFSFFEKQIELWKEEAERYPHDWFLREYFNTDAYKKSPDRIYKAPVVPDFRVPEYKMPKFEPPDFSGLKIPSNHK